MTTHIPAAVPVSVFNNFFDIKSTQVERQCVTPNDVGQPPTSEAFSEATKGAGVSASRCAQLYNPTVNPDASELVHDLKVKAEADPKGNAGKQEILDSITLPFVLKNLPGADSGSPNLTFFMRHNAAETKGDNVTIPSKMSTNDLLKECDELQVNVQKTNEFLRTLPQEQQDEIFEVIHLSLTPSIKLIADSQDEIIKVGFHFAEESGLVPQGTYEKFTAKYGSAEPLLRAVHIRFESSGKPFDASAVYMVFIQMSQKMSVMSRVLSKSAQQSLIDNTMKQLAEKKLASDKQFTADVVSATTEIVSGVVTCSVAAGQMYSLRSSNIKPKIEIPELPATPSVPSTPVSTTTQGGGATSSRILVQGKDGRLSSHQTHPSQNTNNGQANSAKNKQNPANKTDPNPQVSPDTELFDRNRNQQISDFSRGLSDVIKGSGKLAVAFITRDVREHEMKVEEFKLNGDLARMKHDDLNQASLKFIALVGTLMAGYVAMEQSKADTNRSLIR
ncbi:hypothetical protein ACVBEF_19465 [Glaciimonas sp. GG7]